MTREEFRDYVDFLRSQDEISYDVYSGLIDGIDTLDLESCEETISRSETIKYLNTNMAWYDEDGEMADSDEKLKAITNLINGVPSVKPKPKMGHWMWNCSTIPSTPVSPEEIDYCGWVCSECKQFPDDNDWDDPDEPPHYRYCPNCGCPMESE